MADAGLNNRTVLVTGASSGLGAHLSAVYAAAGANVVLGARRLDALSVVAGSIGARALPVYIDVTDPASIAAAFEAGEARFGPIDIVIANAGASAPGRSVDVQADAVRSVLDTNLVGVHSTATEAARRMIAQDSRSHGRGRIILVGSITAFMPGLGDAAYAASKAGLAHLGRCFAREWVRQGINVNVVQPGFLRTALAGDWFDTDRGRGQIAGFHRRRLIELDELDGLMLFLASEASGAMTGTVLTIDDGQSL